MICLHCKKEFKPKRATSKYCSASCRLQYFRNAKENETLRTDNNETLKRPINETDNDRIGKAIQGYCHGCGKDFTKIKGLTTDGSYLTQVDNNCICIHCLSKGVTHHSLGLEVNACS